MRFYTKQHLYYCGVDLHARSMFICIIDNQGNTVVHKNIPTDPDCVLKIIDPYREDIVVAVECIFKWY
jgi:predicted NBD/HSP70 family sugar kinase